MIYKQMIPPSHESKIPSSSIVVIPLEKFIIYMTEQFSSCCF
jgi:hypothetical protein